MNFASDHACIDCAPSDQKGSLQTDPVPDLQMRVHEGEAGWLSPAPGSIHTPTTPASRWGLSMRHLTIALAQNLSARVLLYLPLCGER